MKRKKYLLLLFTTILLLPQTVFAKDSTKRMYINIDVLKDGAIEVQEAAELSGEYNGRLRNIEYQNANTKTFTGKKEDFKGSDIYNGTSITDLRICELSQDFNESNFKTCEREYQQVGYASEGTSGVYQKTDKVNGIDLKIFNPSSRKKAFYLSYKIPNVVVMHNDIAEIAWNILGDSYEENIEELKVWVNLPEKDSNLRVFLKGNANTLNGEIQKQNNQTAYIYYNFLGAHNPITVRLMFDKNITPAAKKLSGVEGKDKILEVEEESANEANALRDRIKKQNMIVIILTITWYIVSIFTFIYLEIEKRKNKKVDFDQDYYRDFPGTYGPEILEYLLKKNITDKAMSASLLNIIDKRVLKVEENPDKKKDYFLILEDSEMKSLTENEKKLCRLFIEKAGDGKQVSLSKLQHYGNNVKQAKIFLNEYNSWKSKAILEAQAQNFFKGIQKCQIVSLIVGILSCFVLYLNISLQTGFIPGYFCMILGVMESLYAFSYAFKTEKGSLEYAKWQAFKRFLKDFGLLHEKELPEVKLWGKYLVYATILGCADEVEKAMKIHMDAMNMNENTPGYWDYYYTNRLMRAHLYSTISSSVTTAVASSRSSIASSSSSSGSGFGGGSSFGGGSFGGGGGGGRF